MKRSIVNKILREGDEFIQSFGFRLPPFAYLSPDELQKQDHKTIKSLSMGWDITDYGQGKFDEMGLFLFTVRNGLVSDLGNGRGKLYAEKIMISRQNQLSPMHKHYLKTEDIINRGGGTLVIELFDSNESGGIDRENDVSVPVDGVIRNFRAGGKLQLAPGESVTLEPGIWHAFWGEGDDVLIGEVSTVNDDNTDNEFELPIGRFSTIEEDERPTHLLVSDYVTYLT